MYLKKPGIRICSAIEAEVEQLQDHQPCETMARPKRPRAGRQPLPTHLPRIEHYHQPESCTCGQCGRDLVKIREDVTEQLDVEPAKFFVHRHIRPQYACRTCETITAEPISGSDRWRHGSHRFVGLGIHQQVSGSLAAVPAGTNRRPPWRYPVPLHAG